MTLRYDRSIMTVQTLRKGQREAERYNDMKYTLCDAEGNVVKVGDDYDFADFVNAVYQNDGYFMLDENGNGVEC